MWLDSIKDWVWKFLHFPEYSMYTVLFAINLGTDVHVTHSSVVRTCTVNFFFQLLFCLRYYRGDDKIRSFIWDLITPSENGEARLPRNHMGEFLSTINFTDIHIQHIRVFLHWGWSHELWGLLSILGVHFQLDDVLT